MLFTRRSPSNEFQLIGNFLERAILSRRCVSQQQTLSEALILPASMDLFKSLAHNCKYQHALENCSTSLAQAIFLVYTTFYYRHHKTMKCDRSFSLRIAPNYNHYRLLLFIFHPNNIKQSEEYQTPVSSVKAKASVIFSRRRFSLLCAIFHNLIAVGLHDLFSALQLSLIFLSFHSLLASFCMKFEVNRTAKESR